MKKMLSKLETGQSMLQNSKQGTYKDNSFALKWHNKCPFQGAINSILFRNYVVPKAIEDDSFFTKMISPFFGDKFRFYYRFHFLRHIRKLSKTAMLHEVAVKTYLLFEVKRLYVDAGDYTDGLYNPKDDLTGNDVRDLTLFQFFGNLECLSLTECHANDFKPLEYLKNLRLFETKFYDFNRHPILNIESLNSLKHLEYLGLEGCNVEHLKSLSNQRIKYLDLTRSNLSGISQIPPLDDLRFLNISQTGVSTIDGIERFSALETIVLNELQIEDVTPLVSLPNLKYLVFHKLMDKGISEAQVAKLLALAPNLKAFDVVSFHSPEVLLYKGGGGTFINGTRRIPTSIESGIAIQIQFLEQHYAWQKVQ